MVNYLHKFGLNYTMSALVMISTKDAMRVLKLILFATILCCSSSIAAASLNDKIGQMLIIGFEGHQVDETSPIVKAIDEHNLGGVILFDYNTHTQQFNKNIHSPAQVRVLNQNLQQFTTLANIAHQRENLPLLISVDYEGGKVNRLDEHYGFPKTYSAKKLAEMPEDEAVAIMESMADTLKNAGFNLNFAPVLDIAVNPDNPVIAKLERSFSADPKIVSHYGHLFSKKYLEHKIQCAYKHFPGHGSSTTDSHLGFVDVTDTWHDQELLPFALSLRHKTHCGMIMTAHIVNRKLDPSGLPATLSQPILTGLLRHELGFDGVIVTDDMQMKAIADHFGLEKALTLAINAGADMLIFGNQLVDSPEGPGKIIKLIEEKVASGEISEERINDAYQHIQRFKKGLL
jgi:beta-N-acetylhexosaminidase